MLKRILLLAILGSTAACFAGSKIRPVQSWADFRASLLEEGKSEPDADAEIAKRLSSLNNMDRAAGDDRLGTAAPPFHFDAWLNSRPLALQELRGKVVLVRWWTDTCPFCASSSPALRVLHAEFAGKDFVLIGVFHPKAGRDDPLDVARVERAVAARQFEFPVAIDWNWREGTLKDWWLTGPKRPATSVTFILDKEGIVRFIHPGMEYHDNADPAPGQHAICADDLGRIRAAISQLLAE